MSGEFLKLNKKEAFENIISYGNIIAISRQKKCDYMEYIFILMINI